MRELRLLSKNSDGSMLQLIDQEGVEYSLPISEALRSLLNQPRLVALQSFADQPITVREIQARLRGGEPMETLAREAGSSIEKIERFAGPILQERNYIIGLAREVIIRRESGREPLTFAEVVATCLAPRQVDMTVVEWSTWRLEDASWIIRIQYPGRESMGLADWNFDLTKRHLTALNDSARWIMGEENSPQRPVDHGVVYNSPTEPQRRNDAPRLVAIRENPDAVSAKDGVSGRAKVPSWDEIMFGSSKAKDADPLD